jgi:protein-S-isoprenylcysteine O-methyltransferase Ste14
MSGEDPKRFTIALVKQLFLTQFMLFLQLIIFFVSSGNMREPRFWLYFLIFQVNYLGSAFFQFKVNPELIVQRLKVRRGGSKSWDEVLMRATNLIALVLIPCVAGLDIGRFQWSSIKIIYVPLGILLVFFSSVLLNWAMMVNPYFEPTVRIQSDRGHRVIMTGPYNIVRHPGYLAGILYALSTPIIFGTTYTFIPAGLYVFSTIFRTFLEDEALKKELNGYSEYVSRTKYRLFPGVW